MQIQAESNNVSSRPAAPVGVATTFTIDTSHSSANFRVRHLMVSHVRGELGPVTGTVVLDEVNPGNSRVDVSIDARAINTRDAKRDEHLRSADFFDVGNHPSVTFRSTGVRPDAAGGFIVDGGLTIRGLTRPVSLTVEALSSAVADPWGNTRRGTTARAKLNRKQWDLNWNAALEAGGVLVGEEVQVEIEVELIAAKA